MSKYDDSPEEAEAAIKAAMDAASHLEYVAALAQENLDFAEQTLTYAREGTNEREIADAQWEREQTASDLEGLLKDRDEAIEEAHRVAAYWTD